MSIYPVKVKKFFPPTDKSEDNQFSRNIIHSVLKFKKCVVCGKKPKMKSSWVYHSLPWGHGEDVWCSTWCFEKDLK